ncbi:Dps family protein [Phytoactinopolyspora endophytica]|uniref:Dps family protein n=1 Tax=Phytoactinopolyspora endophytica TaxID=1642495 RepID=UPI00101C2E51|nr:DNA starvation/stationary phase protection protein [Phytoactinopolyspora endophytica]
MTAPESPIKVSGHDVAEQLQPVLVDLIALTLNGKQAHWHVFGKQFRPLHEQLDVIVADARNFTDEFAERIVALGTPVDGRAQAVAESGSGFPEGFLPDDKVIALVVEQLDTVIEHGRRTLGPLESIDQVTQDLVMEMIGTMEKRRWMLAAYRNDERTHG